MVIVILYFLGVAGICSLVITIFQDIRKLKREMRWSAANLLRFYSDLEMGKSHSLTKDRQD